MTGQPSIPDQIAPAVRYAGSALAQANSLYVLYALIAVNLIAFAAFGLDKSAAERERWRISEGALLRWAWLGGIAQSLGGRLCRAAGVSPQDLAAAVLRAAPHHRGGASLRHRRRGGVVAVPPRLTAARPFR
jgi:hypothetical protein